MPVAQVDLPSGKWLRLELKKRAKLKFWEICLSGAAYSLRFGDVGKRAKTRTELFTCPDEAEQNALRAVADRLQKGYRQAEVGEADPTPTAHFHRGRVGALEAGFGVTLPERMVDFIRRGEADALDGTLLEQLPRFEEPFRRNLRRNLRLNFTSSVLVDLASLAYEIEVKAIAPGGKWPWRERFSDYAPLATFRPDPEDIDFVAKGLLVIDTRSTECPVLLWRAPGPKLLGIADSLDEFIAQLAPSPKKARRAVNKKTKQKKKASKKATKVAKKAAKKQAKGAKKKSKAQRTTVAKAKKKKR